MKVQRTQKRTTDFYTTDGRIWLDNRWLQHGRRLFWGVGLLDLGLVRLDFQDVVYSEYCLCIIVYQYGITY